MKQWEKGEILISREPKTLVLYMGDGITDGTFKGRALESENFRLENSVMVNWSREAFEIATKENTPRKWWKYFPLPNWKDGDFLVGGSFTDIDGQKVKAIVIFKNYYDATDFIGERISPFKDGRRIRGSYGIYDFELATKDNTPKELWDYLPRTTVEVDQEITPERTEVKIEDHKSKYQIIKLEPTENQERQYGVMLFNHMIDIVNGDKQLPKTDCNNIHTRGNGIVKQLELIFSDRLKVCNRGGYIIAEIDIDKEYILNHFGEEDNDKLKKLFKKIWDMVKEKEKKDFIEEIFNNIK